MGLTVYTCVGHSVVRKDSAESLKISRSSCGMKGTDFSSFLSIHVFTLVRIGVCFTKRLDLCMCDTTSSCVSQHSLYHSCTSKLFDLVLFYIFSNRGGRDFPGSFRYTQRRSKNRSRQIDRGIFSGKQNSSESSSLCLSVSSGNISNTQAKSG